MMNTIIVAGAVASISIVAICLVVKGNFIGKIILKLNVGKLLNFEVNVDKNEDKNVST